MTQQQAWKMPQVVQSFLNGGRSLIPLGFDQLDIMMRLIKGAVPAVNGFVDLGCGDGILSYSILSEYPDAEATLVDYSPLMIDAAKRRFKEQPNVKILSGDLSKPGLDQLLKEQVQQPVDVVVSGYAIHHLPHGRKYELYEEIYKLLAQGGIFIHTEHVKSASAWGEQLFDQLMVDTKYDYFLKQGEVKDKAQLLDERKYKDGNLLIPVETQCQWLREIGFTHVDCFFKCFELSIFAGRKM